MAIFKTILSYIIPNSNKLRYLSYLPKIREFQLNNKHVRNFSKREELYNYVNKYFVKNKKITYLEFGVFQGESIKYWKEKNTNNASKFYGFDTFTGLPDSWQMFFTSLDKNSFDVGGKPPKMNDKRVKFIKGKFQDTLTKFIIKKRLNGLLIINLDADLYMSTLYVLSKLDSKIKSGTIIILDEFSSPLHEMRALEDYVNSHLRKYKVIATHNFTKYSFFDCVAIKVID